MTAPATPLWNGVLCDPGAHFDGKYEVESKFRVPDLEPIRRALVRSGGEAFMLDNTELDIYLDRLDKSLERNNKFLILRRMRPSERVLWICKGPAPDECVATELPDFLKAQEMYAFMGFGETMRIKKRRDMYFLEESHVTLDHIPELGKFVEIAAMTDDETSLPALRNVVKHRAASLGLKETQRQNLSYREMINAQSKI